MEHEASQPPRAPVGASGTASGRGRGRRRRSFPSAFACTQSESTGLESSSILPLYALDQWSSLDVEVDKATLVEDAP